MEKGNEEEFEKLIAEPNPNPNPNPNPPIRTRSVTTKVPEVEVHLFRRGKGPIDVFKSSLGGWDQDQLEVVDILEKYGFKSAFAFNPGAGRGVPIAFNRKNGRSLHPYKDGSVIYVDGEPKDTMVSPITKILIGVVVMTIMISLALREAPGWMKRFNSSTEAPGWMKGFKFSNLNFPPWVLACVVIVFTRMRKRTRDFLRTYW